MIAILMYWTTIIVDVSIAAKKSG